MTWAEDLPVDLADPLTLAALGAATLILALVILLGMAAARAGRAARASARLAAEVRTLSRGQQSLAGAQATTTTRLDGATAQTAASLGALAERLEAIDRAQANIERLSGDVLGLQDILSNKQARGAFGEIQLHDIVSKALPPDAYRWQAVLGNGRRADCLIDLPAPPGPIVIDSKFPLEPYEALVAAESDHARAEAVRAFRTAVERHIRAIADKYLVPGETADSALMFVPSEAVFAELHARFGDVVRSGFAARVWTVSPTTCMAVLHTLRGVLKDARMREQSQAIRATLKLLHRDVGLVADRVGKLEAHLRQAQGDLDGIGMAALRALDRADRLEALEFDEEADRAAATRTAGQGVRIVRP